MDDLTGWRGESVLSAAAFVQTRSFDADAVFPVLRTCIVVFSRRLFDGLVAEGGGTSGSCSGLTSRIEVARIDGGGREVSVLLSCFGAPASVVTLETAIELGGRQFLVLGSAGSLDDRCGWDDLVLVERSLRGEGTSRHYLPMAQDVPGSARLIDALRDGCVRLGLNPRCGTSWTTDALFRETAGKIAAARGMGAMCVDMETAAMYAVGQARQVHVGALLVVTDILGRTWKPRPLSTEAAGVPVRLLQAVLEAGVRADNAMGSVRRNEAAHARTR